MIRYDTYRSVSHANSSPLIHSFNLIHHFKYGQIDGQIDAENDMIFFLS